MSIEQDYDSNFRYVLVAARRARQLQNGAEPLVPSRSRKACRVAQERSPTSKPKTSRS
jgi:DNA-directed RNA polymerase subunit omega